MCDGSWDIQRTRHCGIGDRRLSSENLEVWLSSMSKVPYRLPENQRAGICRDAERNSACWCGMGEKSLSGWVP